MWVQIKNTSLVKSLEKIGFSDKEALVYVSVLELGGAYPSRIAEYAGIKRSTTYNILATLSVRGLVNEIEKKNKIFYQIDRPHKLISFSDHRVLLAEEGLDRAKKILPEIEDLFATAANRPKVLFFEGPDTVSTLCKYMVAEDGNYDMLAISNASQFKRIMPAKEMKEFLKTKERLNIKTKGILPDTAANRAYPEGIFNGIKKEYWPEMRFVSKNIFNYDAELTVYGKNKIAITKLGEKNVIGVIIEDQVIHDMVKMIFDLSWDSPLVKE